MKIEVNIEQFAISAPWLADDSQLHHGDISNADYSITLSPIKVASGPLAARRRMSHNSKLSISASLDKIDVEQFDYAIFSSRFGEFEHRQISSECIRLSEPMSPIVFSQSVHNTAAGLYSIFKKCTKPTTTIAASQQTLSTALIEAANYIASFNDAKVLVVATDEQYRPYLSGYINETNVDYSVAFVVSGTDCNLRMELAHQGNQQQSNLPEPLRMLDWWVDEAQPQLTTQNGSHLITWSKI